MGKKIQCIGRYVMDGQTLGKGNFARVELAHHSITAVQVAIKIIDRSKLKEDYQKDHLHREARILGQLRHPNIVRLYETLKATTLHCLVLELACGGELQAYIRCHKDGRLPEDKSRPFIRQLVSALHYLHERGVAHRDLKMENIMLDEKQKNVKLVDFGLSITFNKDELMKTHCGSPEYAAPELFAAKDRYGPEIDVWSLGIVMYAMMIGRLPFTTPYTDHYRRQKLVQQMEKGLTDCHVTEMAILSQDCQDMMRKVIEPSPEKRMPLLDMEVHPWVTNSAKLPFFPFQAFPKDRTIRHQGSPSLRQQTLQDSVCSTDDDEAISELSEKLELKKEQVEQTVGETKCDELSAMYNMMLDAKRKEQGLYDIDHTAKPMERRDGRTKRRAKSAPEEKKSKRKGGATEVSADSGPHTGTEGSAEPETRMTSFDFLALCSAPTWLGPERRRSRRRARSPNPAATQHSKNTDGMSVRSQLKRDYMERQNQEASQAAAAADKGEHPGKGGGGHGQGPPSGKLSPNLLSPDHAVATGHGGEGGDGSNPRLHRGSSLKLSRKRARSFGPRQKRRSPFTRSGSVDTPMQGEADDGGGHSRLQGAKSDSLATASPSTLSVAAASLAVAFGGRTSNVLQVPDSKLGSGSGARAESPTLKEGRQKADKRSKSSSLSPPRRAPPDSKEPLSAKGGAGAGGVGVSGGAGGGGRRESLTNVDVHVAGKAPSGRKQSPRPRPNTTTTTTTISPHLQESGADSDIKVPRDTDRLQLPSSPPPYSDTNGSWSTESLLGDSEVNLLPSPDLAADGGHLVQPLHLLDCSQRPVFHQQVPPRALSLQQGRPAGQQPEGGDHGATTAMQVGGLPKDSAPLGASHPTAVSAATRDVTDSAGKGRAEKRKKQEVERGRGRSRDGVCTGLEPGLRALTLDGLVGATGISGNYKDEDGELLANEVDVTMEDEDLVSAQTQSQAQQGYPSTLHGEEDGGVVVGVGVRPTAAQYGMSSTEELLMGPEEDVEKEEREGEGVSPMGSTAPPTPVSVEVLRRNRNKRGSAGSPSQSSTGSGGRCQKRGSVTLQGGKLKTPTTPLSWMVLHSPLARIESFHSDEFELFNSSDNDSADQCEGGASASPLSASTPTLPCFGYKLGKARKKLPKLKSGASATTATSAGAGAAADPGGPEVKAGKKTLNGSSDAGKIHTASPHSEPTAADPLLSSGGDSDHLDDSGDKSIPAGKAKVHPDKECEKMLLKTEAKPAVCNNVITQQPRRQVQQRKKPNPRCSNNNNNDCASSPMLPPNNHHCSQGSPAKGKGGDSNHGPAALSAKAVPLHASERAGDFPGSGGGGGGGGGEVVVGGLGNCKSRLYVPASETNLSGPEFQTSYPAAPTSPDAGLGARVFDFTLLNDSPKGRPCLLSWRPCGDCAHSDVSSEDESECNPDPVVTLDLKSLTNNTVGDRSRTLHTSYQCSGT